MLAQPASSLVRPQKCNRGLAPPIMASTTGTLRQAGPAAIRQKTAAAPRYKTSHMGQRVANTRNISNGSDRWRMATWLDNSAKVEVPVAVDTCFRLWEDRTLIPRWMPWIKSVVVQDSNPALSKWTLSTNQFGRDWEFSWLARNLTPLRNQKIHWVSEPGSTSMRGIEVPNRGQIRFAKRGPDACTVTLTISYEVPDPLVPFANALGPLVTGILERDMVRFRDVAQQTAAQQAAAKSG